MIISFLPQGLAFLDCKKALGECSGDEEKAVAWLREKGLAAAAKRADRTAAEGVVELYSHGNGRVGVMVEVNCETDFVARSDEFRKFAHELALQIAAASPLYITDDDIPASVIEHEKHIAEIKAREEGKPEKILPRIVEGSVNKFKDEFVPFRQAYIRDDNLTIQQLYDNVVVLTKEKIVVRRFARWALGESQD